MFKSIFFLTLKNIFCRICETIFRGCNGFDGDRRDSISEHRVSRTGLVREKFALNIKADEEYALAA